MLDDGEEVRLANGLYLRRTRVRGETALEVANGTLNEIGILRQMPGLMFERHAGRVRVFIPTDRNTGFPLLEEVLRRFPVIASTTADGGQPNLAKRPTARQKDEANNLDLFGQADEQAAQSGAQQQALKLRQDALDAKAKAGLKIVETQQTQQAGLFGAESDAIPGEDQNGQGTLFALREPGGDLYSWFYSALERAITQKMPAKASAAQILSIAKQGATQGEVSRPPGGLPHGHRAKPTRSRHVHQGGSSSLAQGTSRRDSGDHSGGASGLRTAAVGIGL